MKRTILTLLLWPLLWLLPSPCQAQATSGLAQQRRVPLESSLASGAVLLPPWTFAVPLDHPSHLWMGALTGNVQMMGGVGPQGPQGVPGTNGTNGAAATVSVGTTTTGAAGTSATVTNSGTGSAATLNFTVPQGAQGVPGTPGAAGTPGTNGTNGTPGVGYTLGTAGQTAHMNAGGTAFVTDSALLNDGTNLTAAHNLTVGGSASVSGSATVYGQMGAASVNAVNNYYINSATDIIHNNYPTLTFDTGGVFTTSRFMDIIQATGYKSSDGSAGVSGTGGGGDTVKNGLVTALGTLTSAAVVSALGYAPQTPLTAGTGIGIAGGVISDTSVDSAGNLNLNNHKIYYGNPGDNVHVLVQQGTPYDGPALYGYTGVMFFDFQAGLVGTFARTGLVMGSGMTVAAPAVLTAVATKTAAYTLTATDTTIETNSPVTFPAPTAALAGHSWTIINTGGGSITNVLTSGSLTQGSLVIAAGHNTTYFTDGVSFFETASY